MHTPTLFDPPFGGEGTAMPMARPFLRWVGGKKRMLAHLLPRLPATHSGRYFEPFVGGGALLFAKQFPQAFISDRNYALIQTYRCVRDRPDKVHKKLLGHAERLLSEGRPYYDQVRSEFNAELHRKTIAQAARFIFLNHANFNGMYRVNLKGAYNVPYGKNPQPYLPSVQDLHAVSAHLKGVRIRHCGYDSILDFVQRGDFVYLDPPYPALSHTANFVGYTVEGFSEVEQIRLATFANLLAKRGAKVMVSFADVPQVKEWYEGWHCYTTTLSRSVSAKKPAIRANEIILTNYKDYAVR